MSEQQTLIVKKEYVKDIMDVWENGAEVARFSLSLFLDNMESREITFIKEQLNKVHNRLEVLTEQTKEIEKQNKKSIIDNRYFSAEDIINNQFRKYMDILEAKTAHLMGENKKLFLVYFDQNGGYNSLHTLYNAVTTPDINGELMLEIIMNSTDKNRRFMEDYCARLKKLFHKGLIALLARKALEYIENVEPLRKECKEKMETAQSKINDVIDDYITKMEPLFKEWKEKMETVQSKCNAVIDDCIVSFPKLAQQDTHKVVIGKTFWSCQEMAQDILDKLSEKYNWVWWSVRVFKTPRTSCLCEKLFLKKKEFHCPTGKSCFTVQCPDDKLNVMVSYSSSPEPVDKGRIRKFLQEHKEKSVERKALLLFNQLDGGCIVQTIKTGDLACCSSFNKEQHFCEKDDKVYVCVHSV